MTAPGTPAAELVRARVAYADRLRRTREAARQLWRVAPLAAALCLAIAAAARVAGWPALVTLAAVAIAAAALGVALAIARRPHDISDAAAADIDAQASLNGELRSAHWFAHHAGDDPWVDFHLARAAERVQQVDWTQLYPAPAAGRAKAATVALTLGAVALALVLPGRAGILANGPAAKTAAAQAERRAILAALPPDLAKQLEQLLDAAEGSKGKALTGAEVRGLLAKLDEFLKQQDLADLPRDAKQAGKMGEATEADIKAFAERAKKASENAKLQPEVRDALSDMADKLNQAAGSQDTNAKNSEETAATKADAEGGQQLQAKSGSGQQDGAVQTVKEAAGAGGIGVMMMTGESGANSKEAGLGLGGGAGQDRNGNGRLADLAAILRRETIEASVDNPGENVLTGERRKTERGDATVGFTHSAVVPAERGKSTAPPPVPESRRAALRSYFIRKQP